MKIPAAVVAAPTRSQLNNLSPTAPGVTAFYGPAVLALVLQHLSLTMVGLSLVRERTSGLIELFRVAPVSALEEVLGKVLGLGAFAGLEPSSTSYRATAPLTAPGCGRGALPSG